MYCICYSYLYWNFIESCEWQLSRKGSEMKILPSRKLKIRRQAKRSPSNPHFKHLHLYLPPAMYIRYEKPRERFQFRVIQKAGVLRKSLQVVNQRRVRRKTWRAICTLRRILQKLSLKFRKAPRPPPSCRYFSLFWLVYDQGGYHCGTRGSSWPISRTRPWYVLLMWARMGLSVLKKIVCQGKPQLLVNNSTETFWYFRVQNASS